MYIDQTFAHTIVGVLRDELGQIEAYRLENGDTISKEQAVIMAKQGAMKGINEEVADIGEEFLNSMLEKDNK